MKKGNIKAIVAVIASAAVIGCNPLSKMAKKANEVTYEVTPSPLEMHGDSIEVTISGKYPPSFFHKKVTMVVTPYLSPTGEPDNSIKEFKGMSLIGEAADGEGTKIAYSQGGSFSYSDIIPYQEGMEDVDFNIKATASFKTKSKEFDPLKIADGTNVTPLLVQLDDKPVLGSDKFQKTTPVNHSADIHFLVNSSYVRPGEMRDQDMKDMKDFLAKGVEEEYNFKGVNIEAYASPEGEISLNENLADERAQAAKKAVQQMMTRAKIEAAGKDEHFNLKGKGEDWLGFKEMMQESDIKDKDLIIRILEMYDDVTKREKEIKNLAATYVEVSEKILPKLRRAQVTINAEEKAKTDEEIQRLAESAPDSLTAEELLYAATLTDDPDGKIKIYQAFTEVYPEDWRGPNNIAYIHILKGDLDAAETELNKAKGLAKDNPAVMNNLGVIARSKGDVATAKEMYSQASGKEASYNLGVVNILQGDYSSAVANFGGENTFNAALAKLLNGDPDGALKTLEASEDGASAIGAYLKAIVGARTDNKEMLYNSLKTAISKDDKLKEKAKKDLEFLRFRSESEFQSIVS